MYIWINDITGDSPATLQNINILNHYIGMKYIVPEEIPEFTYFPYIIVGITVIGLILFFVNKAKGFLVWIILFLILAAAGIYDFYLWEYDYGHNLDPNAAINVPGMTYQPPLIGKKYLLNFLAISLPSTGGILQGVAILLASFAWWRKKKLEA
jgi:hypothetical protein